MKPDPDPYPQPDPEKPGTVKPDPEEPVAPTPTPADLAVQLPLATTGAEGPALLAALVGLLLVLGLGAALMARARRGQQ